MRWFVEVSPLGKSEAPHERHCVEAAQWQKALAEVRKAAGHDESLRNFSIEVLDDGVRAVDPMQRLRYLMKRAPADAPTTIGTVAPPQPAPASIAAGPSAPPPASASVPTPSGKRPFAQTMMYGSAGASSAQQMLASAAGQVSAAAQAPGASQPVQSSSGAPAAQPSQPPKAPVPNRPSVPKYATPSSPAVVAKPAPAASSPPKSGAVSPPDAVPALPAALPFKVLMQRSEEPSAASPITYRELAYAVPDNTGELVAETFIRQRFDDLKKQLALASSGKLINLAVFDHVFEKKPLRPPLVTLVWKDWKNPEPELRFPMRPGASMPAPSLGLAPRSVPVASQPPPKLVQPAPAPISPSPSVPPRATQPSPQPVASRATQPSQQPVAEPVTQPAAAPARSTPPQVHADVPTPASTPLAIRRESSSPQPIEPSPAVQAAPASTASVTARFGSSPPPQLVGKPKASQAPAPSSKAAQPAAASQSTPRMRRPTPPGGVDIVADLFEVMHDLHFLRDVQEGADFVLALALEKLQGDSALVQLYDINRREFVVARAAGPNAVQTVGGRTSERDPLLTEIMQRRLPFVVDGAKDPRVRLGRWAALGAEPPLVLAAAVAQGGRFLGVLEVGCAPGRTFTRQHMDGMAYIADAFSEFLAARGIVFSDDASSGR